MLPMNIFTLPNGLWGIGSKKIWKPIKVAAVISSFILSLNSVTNAQEEFISPPAKLLTSFPFHLLTGGIILIKARFDDFADSLNFVMDTGSGGISLDSSTCLRLKLKPIPSDKTIRGVAGIRSVSFLYNSSLVLPQLRVDSLNFHVNDYAILSSVYGENIDGIIGYSFFSRYIVRVDYDSLRIKIYSRGTFKYPKGGYLFRPYIQNLPVSQARVKDNLDISSRFYFDTGAGLCLLLSTDFVTDSSLFGPKKRKPVPTLAQGLGGKADMLQTTVKEFRMGPYRFRNVPIYMFDDEYNITSYPSLAGLIGNDLLRRFNLIINYGKREIYMIPNSHYRDPFDYSYTGFSIYLIDGEIKVADVMKNSPGEKAGLKAGDIVIAVDRNFTNNIQTYKTLLQVVGGKIDIIVKRNGELFQLALKVKSIL
jgi:hypothetical protein